MGKGQGAGGIETQGRCNCSSSNTRPRLRTKHVLVVAIPTRTSRGASESVVPATVSRSQYKLSEKELPHYYSKTQIGDLPPLFSVPLPPPSVQVNVNVNQPGAGQLRKPAPLQSQGLRIVMLTSASHDRACFRAGDSPTLTLALDVRGESTSSRSRSSQAYADRIGGMSPDDDGGGGRGCAV
jgi:hypothetical protein